MEEGACRFRKDRPSRSEVAGRVSHGRAAKVDHGRKPPAANEEVSRRDVAANPDRRLAPRGAERSFPDQQRGIKVDLTLQARQSGACFRVVDHEVSASVEVLRSGGWPMLCVQGSKRSQEGRKVVGKGSLVHVRHHLCQRHAVDSLTHRPGPGPGRVVRRRAQEHGAGTVNWQDGGQAWRASVFLDRLGRILLGTWKADRKTGA